MMIPEHEALIRTTWAAVSPRAAALVDRFYEALFEISPESRALFDHTDRGALERKFLATLDELVRVLDDPERLVSVLGPLGRRHGGYGVEPGHYRAAWSALLVALRDIAGEVFTADAEQAWRELYGLVAAVMMRGGEQVGRSVVQVS